MADIKKKLVDGAGLQAAMGIMGNYSDNMDRGVVGGYNQSFPLTAATKGNIYYHKPTNRYYICINNYSGSSLTNPNSNFEELSIYTNRQRLDSLKEIKKYTGSFYKAIKIGKICIVDINANIVCRNPTSFQLESKDLYPCVNFIVPFNTTDKFDGTWGETTSGAASFKTDGTVGLFGGDRYSVTSTITYLSK